jgi:hypothetical protein
MLMFRSPKHPSAKVVLSVDFSRGLDTGETLSGTPTVSVAVVYGTDATPAGLLNGAPALRADNLAVLVPVQAGVALTDYALTITAPTSNPLKVLAETVVLQVRT